MQRREWGICAGSEPPKTALEMQLSENCDSHLSAGATALILSHVLALGGGGCLGWEFHTHHI